MHKHMMKLPDEISRMIYQILYADVVVEIDDYFTDRAETEYWER